MSTTPPPSFTPLPTTPDRTDRATFSTRMQAWFNAIPIFGTQLAALASNVHDNAVDAYNSAVAAAASVAAAAAHVATALAHRDAAATSAGTAASAVAAPLWVSGATYSTVNQARSLINGLAYQRITNGNGTTDPSLDPTNWRPVAYPKMPVNVVTGTAVTMEPQNIYALTNAAASTATGPAAAIASDVLVISVCNGLYTNTFAANGLKVMGQLGNYPLSSGPGTYQFVYLNAALGWWLVAGPAGVFPGYVNQALGIL